MSLLELFLEQYDLYDNPYAKALDILKIKTVSEKGFVGLVRDGEVVILSEEKESNLGDLTGSLIERILKTKTPIISSKINVFPFLGEVKQFFGIPIMNKEQTVGIVCLGEGNYELKMIKEYFSFFMILRLLLEKEQLSRSLPVEEHLKSKDLFLANMSHEIRTPLNGVIGYNQLLLQTPLTKVQEGYLLNAHKCSLNLTQIINDILDFSKLASGKMKLTPSVCRPREILAFVQAILQPKLSKHVFSTECASNVPESVSLDRQKTVQVLINLLSNAIKFTPEGGKITMSVEAREPNTLYFSVLDTGIGIPRESRNKLFRSFSQLDTALNKKYDGSGLGLSISKKLVDLLRGEISFHSEPDQGSEFYFTVRYENVQTIQNRLETLRPLKGKKVNLLTSFDHSKLATLFQEWGLILSENNQDLKVSYTDEKADLLLQESFSSIQIYENLEKEFKTRKKTLPRLSISGSIRILIVEDVKYNQELLEGMLRVFGYTEIEIASDGIEAIQALRRGKFDLVLLDLKIPRLDGFQVLEYMKNNNISLKTIVVTASVLEEDQTRCKRYGAMILRKPINMDELRGSILKTVGR